MFSYPSPRKVALPSALLPCLREVCVMDAGSKNDLWKVSEELPDFHFSRDWCPWEDGAMEGGGKRVSFGNGDSPRVERMKLCGESCLIKQTQAGGRTQECGTRGGWTLAQDCHSYHFLTQQRKLWATRLQRGTQPEQCISAGQEGLTIFFPLFRGTTWSS